MAERMVAAGVVGDGAAKELTGQSEHTSMCIRTAATYQRTVYSMV